MNKLLLIITLFVSSFFIFYEDAKADDYTKEVDFSLMEDVLSLKEKLDDFIKEDTTYSDYYIISFESAGICYYVLPIDSSIDLFTTVASITTFRVHSNQSLNYGTNLTNISPVDTAYNDKIFNMWHNLEQYVNHIILYSNFDLKYTISGHSITYTYQDFSYTENFIVGNNVSTLYDIYLRYQEYLGIADSKHQEEIDKVTNFYNIVIEKISYLAEQIASNYIYLSIIVIFIVIFVFLLIFRRFL